MLFDFCCFDVDMFVSNFGVGMFVGNFAVRMFSGMCVFECSKLMYGHFRARVYAERRP